MLPLLNLGERSTDIHCTTLDYFISLKYFKVKHGERGVTK